MGVSDTFLLEYRPDESRRGVWGEVEVEQRQELRGGEGGCVSNVVRYYSVARES